MMHYYRHWWIMYCIFWPAGKHIGTLLCHLLQDLKVLAQTSITIKNLLNLKWHRTFETQNIRLMFVHICGWKSDLQQTYKPYTLVRPGLKTGTRPPSCNTPREPTIYASTFSGYFAWTSVWSVQHPNTCQNIQQQCCYLFFIWKWCKGDD